MAEPRPVPEGYTTVTPWIVSRDIAGVMAFAAAAFGAEELARVPNADGSIGHAEMRIGDAVVMGFDSQPGWPPTPAFLRLYLPDGDAAFARAVAAGAEPITEMTHQFFGDRIGRVRDSWGNIWWIQTRVEELAPEEVARRALSAADDPALAHAQETLDRAMREEAARLP
ncbi:MAG TPA: VOC family protein [Solirubrobacteraceae bacterium]